MGNVREGSVMRARSYFPLGQADGQAFCNRKIETQWLQNNIEGGKHSLLVAPRRFGKTSLAHHAMRLSRLTNFSVSFNTCSDENDIEQLIHYMVTHLVVKIAGPVENLMSVVKNYLTHLTPKISLSGGHTILELVSDKKSMLVNNIEESLMLLERMLENKSKYAVVLLDEFQIVGQISKGRGVEAAIRNVAQKMKYLSIIFSGSNQNLLANMFEDKSKPLYKLCRKLSIKQMAIEHYKPHLNKAAKLAWKKELNEEVLQVIMALTARHPYYVNYLCDIIWTECDKLPTKKDVDAAWKILLNEEESDANVEIALLSMGQRKILKKIAMYPDNVLMSAESVSESGMALSSIAGAIQGLIDKDFLQKNESKYHIINPVIAEMMRGPV